MVDTKQSPPIKKIQFSQREREKELRQFNYRDYPLISKEDISCGNTIRSLRCVACNKLLTSTTPFDMCPTCQRKGSEFYVYTDSYEFQEYPLDFEREEYLYLKEHAYLE